MLQQTQVATVKPYFERFLKTFPTVEALARADEQEVLRLWEGLGYYRRARQLHEAARRIVEEHGGRFPRDVEAVRRLPGIGRYTAGAILSIAFDARLPVLEANTLRLFSRLLAFRGVPTSAPGNRLLWAMAEAVLPRRNVGQFNQALMELGSVVCLPRSPRCEECPAAALCRARALGLQTKIPCPKKKPAPEDRHEAAVIVRRRGRVLLMRRGEGQRWAGLWDFPRVEVSAEGPEELRAEVVAGVRKMTGVTVAVGERLITLRHSVTRFRIRLDCYEAAYVSGPGRDFSDRLRWPTPEGLSAYPLSATGRKLSRLAYRPS
jgi:A/G-specific adenine glycosylase